MAGQFRFRLPWLSAAAPAPAPAPAPRPIAEPQKPPPTTEIQAPPRPTTTIPVQRPPFRPPGIAPAQPPPQAQAPPRTEPQPGLPARATTQTPASSVPTSPSRPTTRTRGASAPPSPPRAAQQSRAASVPPSPSRTTFQPQAADRTPTRPKSPPRLATQQRPGLTSSQPSSPTRLGRQVQQPSRQVETKPQREEEMTSRTVPKYQAEPMQASAMATAVAEALRKSTASRRLDSDVLGADHPESVSQPEKRVDEKEGKRVVEELKRDETTSHAEKKQQEEEIFVKKKTTDSSNGEQMKTARARHAPSESHPKPDMSNGEKPPLYKEIREDISKFVHKLGTGLPKDGVGEKPVSILTLAGENKGASMHVGSETVRKDGSIHIHRGYKSNPDDTTEATTDGEGSSKGKRHKDPNMAEEPARKAYVNSNTQSVNNSILFESSITEGRPGVHLNFSYDPAEPTKQSAKAEPLDTRKAEFNITPAEKHTYEPTVRRRCLRGLFLESSDSDPDNPEKPRRHGCRYSCAGMSKDKDIALY